MMPDKVFTVDMLTNKCARYGVALEVTEAVALLNSLTEALRRVEILSADTDAGQWMLIYSIACGALNDAEVGAYA